MKLSHLAISLLIIGLIAPGCRSLDRFNTERGEAFCGTLIAPDRVSEGFEFWLEQQQNQNPPLYLSVTLDTNSLQNRPGKVRSNDSLTGPCAPYPLFENAPLRTVKTALGDRISSMQLADDHEEDILTYLDSTCSGSMVAILSLIQNGSVELRLLRPAPDDPGASVFDQPRFGVFGLRKEHQSDSVNCNF